MHRGVDFGLYCAGGSTQHNHCSIRLRWDLWPQFGRVNHSNLSEDHPVVDGAYMAYWSDACGGIMKACRVYATFLPVCRGSRILSHSSVPSVHLQNTSLGAGFHID